jgi:hypothetical protein
LLAACGLPGGGEPEAVLVAVPPAALLDLPATGSAEVHQTVTVTNIGHAPTGNLGVDDSSNTEDFTINSPGGDCLGANLDPGDSCEFEIIVTGHVPDEPYEASWRLFGADSGDVTIGLLAF